MIAFKVLWIIDALASLVVLYFFVEGLGDGTVSGRNMNLWCMILAALSAVMLGSIWLKSHHYTVAGIVLLLILSIPVLFFCIYILIAMFSNQRWN
jgi:apolipoprotein N-acyltransferase